MRRLSVLLTCLPLFMFLPGIALAADAKNFETDFSITEKERVMRACVHADSKEMERCMARQKRNATAVWGKSSPTTAFQLYDSQDWGKNHLRYDLIITRRTDFKKHWSVNRRAWSAFTPTDDINTRRLPYVNTVREERLDCMYEPAGRPRALCLDRQQDAAQKMKVPVAEE